MQRLATDLPTLSLFGATDEDQLLEIATNVMRLQSSVAGWVHSLLQGARDWQCSQTIALSGEARGN